jgi:hypothetical protein
MDTRYSGGPVLSVAEAAESQTRIGSDAREELEHELVEAAREGRARDACLGGQLGDGPRVGRVVVDQPERLADDGQGVSRA